MESRFNDCHCLHHQSLINNNERCSRNWTPAGVVSMSGIFSLCKPKKDDSEFGLCPSLTSNNKKMVWTQEYHTLIEKDHLGDWSPEKDCCLCLTFRQPVQKPSSSNNACHEADTYQSYLFCTDNGIVRAVSKWLSKVITWLRFLRLVIGLKDSRQFFNQWEAKPKPIAPCTRDISRASGELQVIARNCDWFMELFVPVVIGRSNCFGFGFSTVIWKPL